MLRQAVRAGMEVKGEFKHLYKKPSSKVLESKERRFRILKMQIAKIDRVANGSDCDFWKAYKSLMKSKIDALDFRLDTFQTLSEKEIDRVLIQKQTLKMLLALPDDAQKDMERLHAEQEKIKTEISEYKQRLTPV